mgnify:CR=1 FL=1
MLPGGGNESQLLREKAEYTSIATGGRVLTMEARCFYKATGKSRNFGGKNEYKNYRNVRNRISHHSGGMAWVAEHNHGCRPYLRQAVWELIGGANAPGEVVREEIRKARELTKKPFGVNVMLLSPHADDVAKVVVEEGIKVVTTGAGNPEKYMDMWKAAGVKVIPVVASVALARRMEKYGADAVVAEGMDPADISAKRLP